MSMTQNLYLKKIQYVYFPLCQEWVCILSQFCFNSQPLGAMVIPQPFFTDLKMYKVTQH